MNDGELFQVATTRRSWLAHCTALAAMPTWASASPAAAGHTPQAKVLLVVGDSLSAEYGLKRGSGWVALLDERVKQQRIKTSIVNASISGDTTAGGRSRLPALLALHHPDIVVIELGGNDALRGLPLATTQANLAEMVRASKSAGAKVLLVGMQVPPNYGRRYSDDFSAIFGSLARTERVSLVPFMLKGVADGPQADTLFQADRIHPKEAAHPLILENVWPALAMLLR